jgi:transcriptional regulator with XRE-family HTH domain
VDLKKKYLRIITRYSANSSFSFLLLPPFLTVAFVKQRAQNRNSRGDKDVLRNLQQLGDLLKRERERSGLTVRQVAEAAELAASTVSRLETGITPTPRPDHLQRLARVLEIDVENLYAASGYLTPGALPELRSYLRAKYGLTDEVAVRIEGYMEAVREDTERPARKEGRHELRDKAP